MAMSDGMGVMPVYNLDRSGGDGMFGGNGGGSWVFFLFFLLAWGGNGFGGFGGNGGANAVNNDFLYTNLNNQVGRIQDQNTYNMNTLQQGLCSLGYDNLAQFKDLTAQLANCCCETNRNIDAVRYENERNTCTITNAIHQEGEATRALITQNELQSLRDRLASAEFGLSQQAQTANLIATLRPFPTPSYITCSPYTSAFNNHACGFNNGCGCV